MELRERPRRRFTDRLFTIQKRLPTAVNRRLEKTVNEAKRKNIHAKTLGELCAKLAIPEKKTRATITMIVYYDMNPAFPASTRKELAREYANYSMKRHYWPTMIQKAVEARKKGTGKSVFRTHKEWAKINK